MRMKATHHSLDLRADSNRCVKPLVSTLTEAMRMQTWVALQVWKQSWQFITVVTAVVSVVSLIVATAKAPHYCFIV